jgi:hypothetical protein
MSKAAEKVKEEVRKILVVGVFFFIGFCLIDLSNRLLTRGSGIEIASLTRVVIGSLIVAKVLMMVDLLPFVNAFPGKPLVHNIAWKTCLYLAGGVVFLYIEPFAKSMFRGAGLHGSHSRAWHELMSPRTAANLIWVAMLLVAFVTLMELSRVIGKEQLKHMFLGDRRRLRRSNDWYRSEKAS